MKIPDPATGSPYGYAKRSPCRLRAVDSPGPFVSNTLAVTDIRRPSWVDGGTSW